MSLGVSAVLLYRSYLSYWFEMLWVDLSWSPSTASDIDPARSGTHSMNLWMY